MFYSDGDVLYLVKVFETKVLDTRPKLQEFFVGSLAPIHQIKSRNEGQKEEVYYMTQQASGRGKVSFSAHPLGKDMRFRFK
jgi:hypothetical protein